MNVRWILLGSALMVPLLSGSVAFADVACEGKDEGAACVTSYGAEGTCKEACELLGGSGGMINCALECREVPTGGTHGGGGSATGGEADKSGGATTTGGTPDPSPDSDDGGCAVRPTAWHQGATGFAVFIGLGLGAHWLRRRRR